MFFLRNITISSKKHLQIILEVFSQPHLTEYSQHCYVTGYQLWTEVGHQKSRFTKQSD